MRALIISEPGPVPPPPDQMPMLLRGLKEWRSRWRSKMESFEFFADGGGWGVVNVADEKELSQVMFEFPFANSSSTHVRPTTNGDEALERLISTTDQMMAAMPAGRR